MKEQVSQEKRESRTIQGSRMNQEIGFMDGRPIWKDQAAILTYIHRISHVRGNDVSQRKIIQRESAPLLQLRKKMNELIVEVNTILALGDINMKEKIGRYLDLIESYVVEKEQLFETEDLEAREEIGRVLNEKKTQLSNAYDLFLMMETGKHVGQKSGTKSCWFLSIFEGLQRCGLLYPIIYNNPGIRGEEAYDPKGSRPIWQKIFEKKMAERGVGPEVARSKSKVGWRGFLASFFTSYLPNYGYVAKDEHIYGDSNLAKYKLLPMIPVQNGGVIVSADKSVISFYTVDKPQHAMFYLGKSLRTVDSEKKYLVNVYNQQANPNNQTYDVSNINYLIKHTFTKIA